MSAPRLSSIKQAAIASLYEYLLTADAEAYWFKLEDIREQMVPQPSGALLHIALAALKNEDELVDVTFEGAEDLYTLTADGIEAAEAVHGSYFQSESDILDVAQEKARIEKIRAALDQLEEALRGSNEFSSQVTDRDKDLISGEVEAAKTLVNHSRFRVSRLISLLVPLLRKLADKFAGSAVGEVAKHLIGLLLP